MTNDTIDTYVRGALALQGYHRLDDAAIANVVMQFTRFEAIAQGFLHVELPLDAEPAPVFQP